MKKNTLIYLSFILGLLVYSGCKDKDEYYDRPEWLEPPIYEVLQEKGTFSEFLKCIDKAGYTETLSEGGYYTLFAPNDEAFGNFYASADSLQSISDMHKETAKKIVEYALIQNRYSLDQLDDYESTSLQQLRVDSAYKRKTSYFKWTYKEEVPEYGEQLVVDANLVGPLEYVGSGFRTGDNNYKDIPYFTQGYMNTVGITDYDYNYFFPDVALTQFNLVDAKLVEQDLYAENGIVHVVDKVILPLKNIEESLAEKTEYAKFKDILDNYIVEYDKAPDYLLQQNAQMYGEYVDIFGKFYSAAYFSPNCENYLGTSSGGELYDDQIEGFTMYAPTDAAIEKFFNEKFLRYYTDIEQMTTDQIADFVNAHMWKNTMWPSKFDEYRNIHGEVARFDPEVNVLDKELCSNGIFYGVDMVQESDLYYTVFGDVALNPAYTTMLKAINTFPTIKTLLKNSNPDINVQMFLLDNDQFEEAGITYNYGLSQWEITDNNPMGTNAEVALERLLNLHIFLNQDVNFEEPGIYKSGMFENGEYVNIAYYRRKYYVTSSGNASPYSGPQYLGPIEDEASNGQSYTLASPILFTTENLGVQLEKYYAYFSKFVDYLRKSAESNNPDNGESMEGYLYNTITKAITDVKISSNTTVLVPNNAAIDQAVADGYLPEITIADFTLDQQQQVYNFVKFHILSGQILAPSIDYQDVAYTQYQTIDGETYVAVKSGNEVMEITDQDNRTATVVNSRSNVLANRAIIHQIDNYLRYPKN